MIVIKDNYTITPPPSARRPLIVFRLPENPWRQAADNIAGYAAFLEKANRRLENLVARSGILVLARMTSS